MNLRFSATEIIEIDNKKYVLKNAEESERQTTIDQINYLKKLPLDIKLYFPEVIESEICNEKVTYLMPFYNMLQLDESMINQSICIEDLEKVIIDLINLLFKKIYCLNKGEIQDNYVNDVYIKRMKKRINYFLSKKPEVYKLLTSPKILINGYEYLNMPEIFKILENPNFIGVVTPPFTTFIHGDLEANHIMFEIEDNFVNFKLLDPRPNERGGDLAYDLGKLFQSVHGMSHELQHGAFELNLHLDKSIPEAEFNIKSNRNTDQYKQLQLILESEINSIYLEYKIFNLIERILFAEATHFISAPPFFLDNSYKDNLAEALYLQGILLFNQFLERYNIK